MPPADPRKPSRRYLVWAAPGCAGILLGAGGELLAPLAWLSLLLSVGLHVWLIALVILVPIRALTHKSVLPLLLGLVFTVLAEVAIARVVMGAPRWVQLRARPVIAKVETWKVAHGQYPQVDGLDPAFPPELRAAMTEARCHFYAPNGDSYRLGCEGVAFTKCDYDGATGRWYGWD